MAAMIAQRLKIAGLEKEHLGGDEVNGVRVPRFPRFAASETGKLAGSGPIDCRPTSLRAAADTHD